jgi:D-alanyl-D-alanine carboxypeptidase (penicillin-binding protein 5/6)
MHGESSDSRNADATALLNYGFARYELCSLLPEAPLPALPVELGMAETLPLRCEGESSALIPKGSGAPGYRLELPESVSAPVEEGTALGTLTVSLGGETLARLPVVAAESVPRLGVGPLFVRLLGSLVGL